MTSFKHLNVIKKFSIISFLFILVLSASSGAIIVFLLNQNLVEREAQVTTAFIKAIAHEKLVPDDFRYPLSDNILNKFKDTFAKAERIPNIFHLNIYDNNATIIWSTVGEMIGIVRKDNKDYHSALKSGEMVAALNLREKIIWPHLKGERGSFIEVYVPIIWGDNNNVIGVVGTYVRATPLFETIRNSIKSVWITVALSGVLLYISLFYIFLQSHRAEKANLKKVEKLNSELYDLNKNLEAKVKERTDRVIRMEKLSAMGEVVGEIAHQLNNPMVGIVNFAQLAYRKLSEGAPIEEELKTIERSGVECKNLITKLLAFSRIAPLELRDTNIPQLIDECLVVAETVEGMKSVQVEKSFPLNMPDASLDRLLMKQAFQNIIQNSIQAMQGEGGGRLAIVGNISQFNGGAYFCIQFTDTGNGVPPEIIPNLFSPFFTTRANGTGLGLSIAREITIRHGGQIVLENAPGQGASFSVYIPKDKVEV